MLANSCLFLKYYALPPLTPATCCGRDSEEFSSKLEHALSHEPVAMTPELQRRLTWEEATERFLDVAELKAAERPGVLETAVDKLAWAAHNTLTGWKPPVLGCSVLCCAMLCYAMLSSKKVIHWSDGHCKPNEEFVSKHWCRLCRGGRIISNVLMLHRR